MLNNRRYIRYSSFTPEFQRRNNKINTNRIYSNRVIFQRGWYYADSSNVPAVNSYREVNGSVLSNGFSPSVRSPVTVAEARNENIQETNLEGSRHFFLQQTVPSTRNDGFPATSASSFSPTTPILAIHTGTESIKEPLINILRSLREDLDTPDDESTNKEKEISEPAMLICSVCLDGYKGVLNKGAHFIALNCGHVFCNMCTNIFKASKKCPKCRSLINSIVKLHFDLNPSSIKQLQ